MKKILFPTDFSPVANQALAFSIQMAHRMGAEIQVLHVFDKQLLETDLLPFHISKALNASDFREAEEQGMKYVETLMRRTGKRVPLRVTFLFGYARDQILQLCQAEEPDLIVMGTSGATNAVEHFFGSTTSEIMLHARCPVLAVPPGIEYGDVRRIAYATDFREKHLKIFYSLNQLAHALNAEIVCIHVETKPLIHADLIWQEDMLAPDMEFDAIPLKVVHHTRVIDGLKQFVRDEQVDILALQPHERYFPQRLWKKSVTQQMVLESDVPVLAVKA